MPFRIVVFLAAFAVAATANAEIQGWRTPDGQFYFGSEPPPGSKRIDSARPTPTARAAEPTVEKRPSPPSKPTPTSRPATEPMLPPPTEPRTPKPTATAKPRPTARATAVPRQPSPTTGHLSTPHYRETPVPRPRHSEPPASEASEDAGDGRAACGEIVAIRDTRPTIDFDRDLVVVTGEAMVIPGGRIKDLVVCLSGSCVPIAPGKVLSGGDTARFSISTARNRPTGFTIRCNVVE